ncbi:MAG TPA: dioxygenase [Xanthobacteraceae bacterium]|jgi:hydroxyquinol 1,2-dioxygenase|nr:dioxygenase [Xanthobacteraceae bacterium]
MTYVTEQNLTDVVLERWQQIRDPRLRAIMQAAIKHLHAFAREVEPSGAEWFAAIDWLTRTGKMCTDKRQEFILASDVLGVSMLVDAINHRMPTGATPTTVEGPFHVADAPERGSGENMTDGAPGEPLFITGTVRGLEGKPLAGAVLDVWQTDGEGLYEAQRDVTGPWMRGLYRTGADGKYVIRTVAPIGYTIPMDGTVGELMKRTEISHMRPAHVHFQVTAPGYNGVVTHLFRNGDPYIETDVVYGVKKDLIVDFERKPAGRAPTGENVTIPFNVVRYDFVLQQAQAEKLRGAA